MAHIAMEVLLCVCLVASNSACGSGKATFCAVPNAGGHSSCGGAPVGAGPEFLYASSTGHGGEVLLFTIDQTSGALSASTATPGPASACGINSAQHKFLYVCDSQMGTIDAFAVDQGSGALTGVAGSPFAPANQPAFSPLATAAGISLYANAQNGLTGFSIGSDGALTTVVGSPYPGGFSGQAVLGQSKSTPINYFLFATNSTDRDGTISVFRIVDPQSGILTPVPGDFRTGSLTGPGAIIFNDAFSNPFVFVALTNANEIAGFSVEPTTGALTAVPGSPFLTGFAPASFAMNDEQNVLYAMNVNNGTISGYNIANTGVLTPISGFPMTVGGHPRSMAVTSNNYLYVTLPELNIIEGFSINSMSGLLAPLPTSPFAAIQPGLLSIVEISSPATVRIDISTVNNDSVSVQNDSLNLTSPPMWYER